MKIIKITRYLTVSIVVVLLSITTYAQDNLSKIIKNGEIRIGMSGNQPPFSMKSKAGQLIGYEVDLATALAESMGVKVKLVEMPFPELLGALEKGAIDAVMSGMTITPQRNLKAVFAGPYMLSGKSILTKSTVLAEISEADEANQKQYKIVCLRGSTSERFVDVLMPESEKILVDKYDSGVDMVLNDKADAMVADAPICIVTVLKYQDKGLVTLDKPLTIEPIGMAIAPDDPQFLNLVQNYLVSLELSGALELLEQIWFEDGSWILDVD